MKNRYLKLILLVIFVFNLCACGSKNFTGDYTLSKMTSNGADVNLDVINNSKNKITLKIEKDGKGNMKVFDREYQLTYDDNNIVIDGSTSSYTVENDDVIIKTDNDTMIFSKNK